MAEQEYEDYKFPDEPKAEQPEAEDEFEIVVEDDTPPEDRGHSPMPKKIVEELEQDELEEFTGKAKEKLSQLKKVWNDERRAKEAASKEAEEASRIAQQLLSENQKLKTKLSAGEQNLINKYKENISYEIEKAKAAYKEAYDSGDSDRLVEAQEKLTTVQMEAKQIERYQPEYSEEALQNSETQVQIQQQPQRLEPKTQSWLDKNSWYGVDDDMSFLAMGIHRRLEREGVAVGSDHYFGVIDKEMRQRFPEKFEDGETKYSSEVEIKPSAKTSKPSTVVAPATRSTSPKRVKLTPTQVQLAKKFNLTPEQYARELTKLESQNG
jgi:myosin heavy subunit